MFWPLEVSVWPQGPRHSRRSHWPMPEGLTRGALGAVPCIQGALWFQPQACSPLSPTPTPTPDQAASPCPLALVLALVLALQPRPSSAESG